MDAAAWRSRNGAPNLVVDLAILVDAGPHGGRSGLGGARAQRKRFHLPGRTSPGLTAAAFLASDAKDFNAAVDWFNKAIALAESLGERIPLAKALDGLGTTTHALGDFAAAKVYHQRAANIAEETGDQRLLAVTTANLGTLDYHLGDLDAAGRRWETCRSILRTLGDAQGEAMMAANLAALAVMRGDYEHSEGLVA